MSSFPCFRNFALPRCTLLLIFSCLVLVSSELQAQSAIRFEDVSSETDIDFIHRDGSSGKHYLVEAIAGSLASFDYDSDGRIDLYFLNGAALSGTQYDITPVNQLHRNLGGFRFENVAEASGLNDASYSLGVAVADYDNDGFADLYVNNFGPNVLYRNNGDGTFMPIEQPALACGEKCGAGVCMLDKEGDGDLDIYVANYIQFDYDIPPSEFRGRVVYGGPLLYPKVTDNLLENNGAGSFRDVTSEAGISKVSEWGMGSICADFDSDGDTDIFVANDSTKNSYWVNDGHGQFTESALFAGLAYDFQGDPQGSMGIDVADIDGDLWLDIFQTAYTKQLVTLYRNDQGILFEDATRMTGVGKGTFYPVNWGTGLGDLDNDGDPDVVMANGHIHDNMDDVNNVAYRAQNLVFENLDGKRFVDVTADAGSGFQPVESSRGLIQDDLDSDGKLDIVVVNSRLPPTLMHNTSRSENHWIELELIGIACNRSAIGTQVVVTTPSGSQILEVHSGKGYQSHFGSRLHFGLGREQEVQSIEIRWHGGDKQQINQLPADANYIIRQGLSPVLVAPPNEAD